MDEDTIIDLKQFIAGTVHTELANLEVHFDKKLDTKIDEVLTAIAETMEFNTEHVESRLDDHEKRLVRLEQKPA